MPGMMHVKLLESYSVATSRQNLTCCGSSASNRKIAVDVEVGGKVQGNVVSSMHQHVLPGNQQAA